MEGCPPELEGTKVISLATHLNGNLGDEMETTPMLKELKRCGVRITGILQAPLGAFSAREHETLEAIATFEDDEFLNPDDYHAVILAPGPWWVKGYAEKTWKNKRIDIFFGGSFMNSGNEWGKIIADVHKPSLVVTREKYSYDAFENVMKPLDFETKHLFSGDLSHSFEYIESSFKYWEREWKKLKLDGKTVMFIRSNNADNYEILREERQVRVKTVDEKFRTVDADDLIFATSAAVPEEGDIEFFAELSDKYKDIFGPEQFQLLDIIEKEWALIGLSTEVITDRYHPGVATHRLGKPLTMMYYEHQQIKMSGLAQTASSTTTEEIKELNAIALSALKQTLVELKKKNSELVGDMKE